MPLSRITNPFLSSSGAGNASITSPAANTVAFTTATTERMRIDSAGNVGIGTSSPTQKLTVSGSSSLGTASASGNTAIFQAPGSLYLILNTNGTLSGARRNWAISPEYDVAGALSIACGASEGAVPSSPKLIIKQQGAVVLSGGSTSADGTGIAFPATQSASSDANTLDDYEEGSWTPACNFAGTSSTVDSVSARYVKIGRQVICSAQFRITAKGAGSGNFELTGLPFACSSSAYNFGNCQGDTVSLGTASSMMPYIPNATSVSRVLTQSPTSHTDLTNTSVNNGCSMYFMLVYTTAT